MKIHGNLRPLFPFSVALVIAGIAASMLTHFVAAAAPQESDVAADAVNFPLEFRIVDPDNPSNANKQPDEKKIPPLIVMFPKGKTRDEKDATGPIGRLESFREKSKLIPESNDDPGLPVFLCGLRFLERKDASGKRAGYEVELQGEFNAVRVAASDQEMQSFLEGKPTTFALESKLQYGIIATVSTTKLEIQRSGDKIYILSVEGDFTFRETIFFYTSDTLKLSQPKGRKYLFYGEKGELPTLRIL